MEALRVSEERLRLGQSADGFGTFDWDIQAQTVIWSGETERIWEFLVGGFEGTYEHWRRLCPQGVVSDGSQGCFADSSKERYPIDAKGQISQVCERARVRKSVVRVLCTDMRGVWRPYTCSHLTVFCHVSQGNK